MSHSPWKRIQRPLWLLMTTCFHHQNIWKQHVGVEKRVRKKYIEGGKLFLKDDREGKRVLTFVGKVDNRQPSQFQIKKVIGDRKRLNQEDSSPPGGFPAALIKTPFLCLCHSGNQPCPPHRPPLTGSRPFQMNPHPIPQPAELKCRAYLPPRLYQLLPFYPWIDSGVKRTGNELSQVGSRPPEFLLKTGKMIGYESNTIK